MKRGNHPDRDAQLAHMNATVKAAVTAGEPTISVDTKEELVGHFQNNGGALRRKGHPEPVRVHDFKVPELGKVALPRRFSGSPDQFRRRPVFSQPMCFQICC